MTPKDEFQKVGDSLVEVTLNFDQAFCGLSAFEHIQVVDNAVQTELGNMFKRCENGECVLIHKNSPLTAFTMHKNKLIEDAQNGSSFTYPGMNHDDGVA